MKFFLIILKNLRRNLLRTTLTGLAIMVLVFMITLIWTVVYFLGKITEEKTKDFKLLVTEKWQLPSQMPLTHGYLLDPAEPECIFRKAQPPIPIRPDDFMTWSFYGGTIDPGKLTRDSVVFLFVMDPRKIRPMMDDLEDIDEALVQKLLKTRNGCLIGRERLEAIHKRVGDKINLTCINFKNIDLEFEIVGLLPEGRYNQSAIMNDTYLNEELDHYPTNPKNPNRGKPHPLADKRLTLIWLRVRDHATFERVADLIENGLPASESGVRRKVFVDPEVKCETASSGVAAFLDAYRDLLWGIKWLLVPAILVSMTLVIANAISISVRERRIEMAVLKVLGFRPGQVMVLVLGEALLVGGLSGFLAGFLTFGLVDYVLGGVKFPIAFFPAFMVPVDALWWGLSIGLGTALLGSVLPAWSARTVKVSEVFAKVA